MQKLDEVQERTVKNKSKLKQYFSQKVQERTVKNESKLNQYFSQKVTLQKAEAPDSEQITIQERVPANSIELLLVKQSDEEDSKKEKFESSKQTKGKKLVSIP